MRRLITVLAGLLAAFQVPAQPFQLPTANQHLFEPGGHEHYFVGTVGRDWRSGMFGCVRSDGWQMHEGLDIKCLQRDKSGEPIDPVMAAADGQIAYMNDKAGLSNYGNYLVIRHRIGTLDVCTLYAHLRSFQPGLRVGQQVRAGQVVGTLGRTANTSQGISRERAHLHFEITFLINERFTTWRSKNFPGMRNDHGIWNGQNLVSIDPLPVLYGGRLLGSQFDFLDYMRKRPEMFRVLVRAKDFPWQQRNRTLVKRNPVAEKQGVEGYEIAFDFNGVPFLLIPRAASEIPHKDPIRLLSVNEAEQSRNPCRKLVSRRGDSWELTSKGRQLVELLTY